MNQRKTFDRFSSGEFIIYVTVKAKLTKLLTNIINCEVKKQCAKTKLKLKA